MDTRYQTSRAKFFFANYFLPQDFFCRKNSIIQFFLREIVLKTIYWIVLNHFKVIFENVSIVKKVQFLMQLSSCLMSVFPLTPYIKLYDKRFSSLDVSPESLILNSNLTNSKYSITLI